MGYTAEQTVEAVIRLPQRVWGVAEAIVGLQHRDPDSPVSIVGGSRLAGETVSLKGFPLTEKVVYLLMLIAGFNFFIGAFNFIPLLPLDGGHIASALWEAVRRGFARLRGLPDPGFVDAARAAADRLRDGVVHAGDEPGADRRRPRRTPPPADLTPARSGLGPSRGAP